jgi:2-oxoglutarate dehydrogenase E2 component (dihydrolipoamide succinyltransferase)
MPQTDRMVLELKVPAVGESITEVQIGTWLKSVGDSVATDDSLVEIESDKATVELPAPASGKLTKILKQSGEMAAVGDVIAHFEEGAAPSESEAQPQARSQSEAQPQDQQQAQPQPPLEAQPSAKEAPKGAAPAGGDGHVMPSAARLMATSGVARDDVEGTGPGGRVLKEDVQRMVERKPPAAAGAPAAPGEPRGTRDEELVPMSMLRRKIAENLVRAQQEAALLTTFNEIDMSAVIALRKEHQPSFQEKHGIKLGFMSFFVKAAVDALRLVPAVNAEVRGSEIAYRHYQDIGIAVGGGRGLVVPILRNAESMGFAEIELAISDLSKRAKDNKITLEELTGGTFTISNGGIYGSLLSTPIVNPPQSGILGLHAIQERPVAIDGEVVVRPMMYVALTYDHRLVDGREAVTFLKRIKECVETPSRMLLEV